MTPTLKDRLQDAKDTLAKVDVALRGKPGRVPPDAETTYRLVVDSGPDIDHWLTMLEARAATWKLLDGLESKADHHDLVLLGDLRAGFIHVRLIGVQAYLAITWALADRITGMAGRILCTPGAGQNRARPAQLVSHFIQKDRSKNTAGLLYESLRLSFGWPIGISYAIRNHFIHDGSQNESLDFFEAGTAASGFRISEGGWDRVEKRAREQYDLDVSCHRASAAWPDNPCDDLREVLRACEQETDDALGVILGSACHTLRTHVGFLLGEG